jgi:hypothetical protein
MITRMILPLLLVPFLVLHSACSSAAPPESTPSPLQIASPDTIHYEENTGEICFTSLGETSIEGRIIPAGCYSGSCTKPSSQLLTVYVDNQSGRLTLEFGFVIEDYSSVYDYTCTEDCSAGLIFFSIDNLTDEFYEIWVANNRIGEIEMQSDPICFEVQEGE